MLDDPAKARLQTHSGDDTPLRKAILNREEEYIAVSLAISLTKLIYKTRKNLSNKHNKMTVDAILIIC